VCARYRLIASITMLFMERYVSDECISSQRRVSVGNLIPIGAACGGKRCFVAILIL